MVVDFTVKSDGGVAVGAAHGLVAAGEIDNAEPRSTERDVRSSKAALLVGAAMDQGGDPGVQNAGGESSRAVCIAKDSTHMATSSLGKNVIAKKEFAARQGIDR
jgi:hypothetical protein